MTWRGFFFLLIYSKVWEIDACFPSPTTHNRSAFTCNNPISSNEFIAAVTFKCPVFKERYNLKMNSIYFFFRVDYVTALEKHFDNCKKSGHAHTEDCGGWSPSQGTLPGFSTFNQERRKPRKYRFQGGEVVPGLYYSLLTNLDQELLK